ncbi:SymE family type I addiction module toxin [Pantoea sp. B65]|uniref:SymE family type I addiction module toxin n=1 Tax=Pantoea sp. B65 TaxID=2813359 RepID=UPI0039B39398
MSKTERRCIVRYRPQRGDHNTPALNLYGKWLREAGFETGSTVTVRVEASCLILITGG